MRSEDIAAYLEDGLDAMARESIERHLLVCAECRQDLAEASELVGASRRRRLVGVGASLATAATVALLWFGGPQSPEQAPAPTLRGPGAAPVLMAVSPADGVRRTGEELRFVWRTAAGVMLYTLTVTDANGDLVFRQETADTSLLLPDSVPLRAGTYYWLVDALFEGARSATTGAIQFVVEEP